jgi:hypothetical protein
MATNRLFQDMLNEYLTYDLLKEEIVKRDYLLSKIEKDNGWKGGTLPVPFKGASASSFKFGGLTDQADISQDEYVRGEITSMPEIWGSLLFNHRDIMEHNGKIKETTFLRILPDVVEDFMQNMKNAVSQNLLTGNHIATLTADGTALGVAKVDRVERFTLGQKLQIISDAPLSADVYIIAININADTITVSATRGGAALDISAYLIADNTKFYIDGAATNSMTSLRRSLLSLANGGTANLYGKSKLAYPYLQSINLDGSTITSANVLDKLFDGFTTIRNKGKGNANTVLMSYKWLGHIMKKLEDVKSPYKVDANQTKVSLYGWTEISIVGVKGVLNVVGIQEMDDDIIMYLDWRALKFHTNGFFQKRTSPDGSQYYEVRTTAGYFYIVDSCLFGDMVLSRPSTCGIYHSIP